MQPTKASNQVIENKSLSPSAHAFSVSQPAISIDPVNHADIKDFIRFSLSPPIQIVSIMEITFRFEVTVFDFFGHPDWAATVFLIHG